MITINTKIYIAGHQGMVGSAIHRQLKSQGLQHFIVRSHKALDLTNQRAVNDFFQQHHPDFVFLAAAKVGGIFANNTYPAAFIRDNLAIQTNIIHAAWKNGVQRLLFLGSSCIYPRDCPQPMQESHLLTGPLELTNRAYALAKIAGIEMCGSYNRQYGTHYLAVMPTNLYGYGDNYHPENSHVLPALIRRIHEAKINKATEVVIWGTGKPLREFLFSDDMAHACIHLMNLDDKRFQALLGNAESYPLINIGSNIEVSILTLAKSIAQIINYKGNLTFDTSKPDGSLRKLLDSSRIHQLGWQSSTSLDEGIKLAYADFLKTL